MAPRFPGVITRIAAALLVTGALWLTLPRFLPVEPREFNVDPGLRLLVGDVSSRGLILPGGEEFAATEPVAYRSGEGPVERAAEAAIGQLIARNRSAPLSVDEAVWLVASLVAVGRLDEAISYNEAAHQRHPGEVRFVRLAAVIDYQRSNLGPAEQLLRQVLGREPGDGASRLNLGIVLREQGHLEAADSIFQDVSRRFPDSPLSLRAIREQKAGTR